jgi:Fe2+ transport system protein FeoA
MSSRFTDGSLFCALVRRRVEARQAAHRALVAQFGPEDETGHIEVPLSVMLPGDDGHVLALRGNPEYRQHLLELGFTPGTPVTFVRSAPLGDPITVRVRGYQLSLRRREAEAVLMRRCPPMTIEESMAEARATAGRS